MIDELLKFHDIKIPEAKPKTITLSLQEEQKKEPEKENLLEDSNEELNEQLNEQLSKISKSNRRNKINK